MEDPFARLTLPRRFYLADAEIESAYLRAVGGAHPDAPGGGADAGAINAARTALRDPEARADALLLLLGGPSRAEQRGLPDGLLMEMMEIRQQIEREIAEQGALARARWEAWAEQRRAERLQIIGGQFGALGDPPDPARLRDIRVQLNALRYIERLIEQLDPEYDPASADFDR